jgi:hypothetical protein
MQSPESMLIKPQGLQGSINNDSPPTFGMIKADDIVRSNVPIRVFELPIGLLPAVSQQPQNNNFLSNS